MTGSLKQTWVQSMGGGWGMGGVGGRNTCGNQERHARTARERDDEHSASNELFGSAAKSSY